MFSFDNQAELSKIARGYRDKYVARKRVLQNSSTSYLRDVTRDINPGIQMTRREMVQQILRREFPPR